jgi:hypothetical protein
VRVVALILALALVLAGCGGASESQPTATSASVDIGQGLAGPAGLKATLYATGLQNVSAFAFDARGRLWASTSAASTGMPPPAGSPSSRGSSAPASAARHS